MRFPVLTFFPWLLLAAFGLRAQVIGPPSPWQDPDEPRIIIVNSYHHGFWWSDEETSGIISGLQERWPTLQPAIEYLDLKKFPNLENETNFVGYVARKYAGQTFDLFFFVDGPALKAAQRHPYLVGDKPIVYCGVDETALKEPNVLTNITGVVEAVDVKGNLRLIDRLMPALKEIHFLGGRSQFGVVTDSAREIFGGRELMVEYVPRMSLPELLEYASTLRPGSVLVEHGFQTDDQGRLVPPEFRIELTRRSSVPHFVHYEMGHGIGLGGRMLSAFEHGRQAAGLGLRVLDGEPAGSIPPLRGEEAIHVLFDHGQLKRFGIDESSLPPDAVVLNRPPSVLRRYRNGLFALAGFTAGLLVLSVFLIRSNRRRRALFEQASDAIFVTDLRAVIVDVNATACAMFGYSRKRLLGLCFSELVEPGDLERRPLGLEDVLTGQPLRSRRRLLRADGSVIVADCNTSRLPGGLLQGIIRDVSEREAAERRVQESEERFRTVAESVEEIVYEWRPDTDSIWRTENAGAMLGYPPDEIELTGRWWLDRIHPDDAKGATREIGKALADGNSFSLEYRVRHRDGSYVHVWDKGRVFRDGEGHVTKVIGGTTNLTERRHLEAQVRQAQKMEAIGTLAGGIAHDFNNILSGVLGNAELARLDLPDGHPVHGALDQILKATDRARSLINQILTFGRRGEEPHQSVDLALCIREAHRLLRSTIPMNVEVTFDCPAVLPPVVADQTQIYQSLMNLATNAWQAMEAESGRIEISARPASVDEAVAQRVGDLRSGPHLLIQVRDTGPGMSAEIRDRVFEPFFTTKVQGRGTGLGLAVVHGIVRSHHGAITIDTAPGQGATFSIYLPIADSPAAPERAVSEAPPAGEGRRVMFVDDEPMLLSTGSQLLRHLGYEVDTFSDPAAALKAFEDRTDWDVVVTDLSMPGMTGVELAARLKAVREVPMVLMSGYLGDGDAEDYRDKGFQLVLQKPLGHEALGRALGSVFGSRSE
jgi:PAS domain S-box-containing protein